MNELQAFSFENRTVRTQLDEYGNPWWVAKDICELLGLDTSKVGRTVEEEDRVVRNMPTPSGNQNMVTVNESGLYTLILKSRKTEAKRFKKWITSVVLPEIRRTGSFNANGDWKTARIEGKQARKLTTDIISLFVEYAKRQGSTSPDKYYMNFSKMINDALLEIEGEKPKNLRDHLNVWQLHTHSVGERIIAKSIAECMSNSLPYKEIFQIVKANILKFASTVGKSKLGQTERQMVGFAQLALERP